METLISVSEAAKQLGLAKRTLQDWDRNGKLVALRTAGGTGDTDSLTLLNFKDWSLKK